jgi:hypothetical protein
MAFGVPLTVVSISRTSGVDSYITFQVSTHAPDQASPRERFSPAQGIPIRRRKTLRGYGN